MHTIEAARQSVAHYLFKGHVVCLTFNNKQRDNFIKFLSKDYPPGNDYFIGKLYTRCCNLTYPYELFAFANTYYEAMETAIDLFTRVLKPPILIITAGDNYDDHIVSVYARKFISKCTSSQTLLEWISMEALDLLAEPPKPKYKLVLKRDRKNAWYSAEEVR